MDALPVVLASVRVVGWTLLHFVWQGALLGLLYAVARAVLPRGEARYRFGMAILVALALCPLLTLWRLLETASQVTPAATALVIPLVKDYGTAAATTTWAWGADLDMLLPWLVLAWSLGVLLLSLRAWRQWRGLKALVQMAALLPEWQSHVAAMAGRFGLRRRITVLCSKVIATPAVVGWMRPVILLPMAVVCNFPVEQVELILAHELAHLRRWDPFANLFQVVLETLCFYHPVVHWVSRDVRNEREICCDELALSVSGGSRHAFVTALAELGELRRQHASLLLAASGGVLLDRVQHMVLPRERNGASMRTSARFVAVLLGAALVALTLRLEWKLNHLQSRMTAAITQLKSMWTPSGLPLMHADVSWHPADLALVHAQVQRPMESLSGMADDTDSRGAMALVPVAMKLPQLVPLQVANLLAMPQAEQVAAAAMPVVPAAPSAVPAPTLISARRPAYPHAAFAHGIEGQVVIEFGLSAAGDVLDPRVISARPAGVFDQAAIDAIRTWKYALSETGATSRRYRQAVAFTLKAGDSGTVASRRRADCQVVTGTHICRGLDEVVARIGHVVDWTTRP